jgi:hypothetical protein
VQPQLSPRSFPSILALGTLLHGGILLLPNPIFRSGEDCRHSNLNNRQDIARKAAPRIIRAILELTSSEWRLTCDQIQRMGALDIGSWTVSIV